MLLIIWGTDEHGMLRQSPPDDRVIHLFPTGAPDDKPDGKMIAGNRSVTIGPNCDGKTLKITELGHREVEESTINARQLVDGAITPHILSCEEGLYNFNRAEEGGKEGRQRGWGRHRGRSGYENWACPRPRHKC